MQRRPLEEIVAEPEIQELYRPLFERHLNSIELIRSRAHQEDGVLFFDLTGHEMEGYNKFIPYYLFPTSVYTVSVSPSSFRTKISVGSNPWAEGDLEAANLATICERYGGGGTRASGSDQLRARRAGQGAGSGGGDCARAEGIDQRHA